MALETLGGPAISQTRLCSGLASHWLNPDYADAEALIVVVCGGGGEQLVARLPVHRLVLTAVSERSAVHARQGAPVRVGAVARALPCHAEPI